MVHIFLTDFSWQIPAQSIIKFHIQISLHFVMSIRHHQKLDEQLESDFSTFVDAYHQDTENLKSNIDRYQSKIEIFIQKFEQEILQTEQLKITKAKYTEMAKQQVQSMQQEIEILAQARGIQDRHIEKLAESLAMCRDGREKTLEQINNRVMGISQTESEIQGIIKDGKLSRTRLGKSPKMPVSMDSERNQLVIKTSKNGLERVFTLKYHRKQDRFSLVDEGSKNINKVVNEFNFHRDIKLLFEGLSYFSQE